MKELLITVGYFLLAQLEGILYLLFLALVGGPLRLWEKWRYTAQCLRYPPPRGGMFGNMAREYKNRPNKPDKPDRQ